MWVLLHLHHQHLLLYLVGLVVARVVELNRILIHQHLQHAHALS